MSNEDSAATNSGYRLDGRDVGALADVGRLGRLSDLMGSAC
jgi:hypothetical protein